MDFAINAEAPRLLKHWVPGDDHLARELAGEPPPVEETIIDAVEWMIQEGHIRGGKRVSARP